MDEYYDEEEDQNFDDLDSEQMMKMIEQQQDLGGHDEEFNQMLEGENDLSGISGTNEHEYR